MTWYGASLLYQCSVRSDVLESPIYEERIIVVNAADDSVVRTAAELAGKAGTLGYDNADGDRVDWLFVEVVDVKELFDEHVSDGTEVFYRYLTAPEVEVLRRAASERIELGGAG